MSNQTVNLRRLFFGGMSTIPSVKAQAGDLAIRFEFGSSCGTVLLATAALAPGLVAFQVIDAEAIEDLDAYAVYAAIVPMQVVAAKPIAIRRETWKVTCLPSGNAFNEEWRSVLESFKEENGRPRTLLPRFPPEWPYERMPQTDVSSPRWGGYARVSAVGFNEAKRRAMLFVMSSCGPFCSHGTFHFLEKREAQWLPITLKDISNCNVQS